MDAPRNSGYVRKVWSEGGRASAFGTGSFSGQVQRDLGQDGFTRLVRYAYDNGIRFFETAESYGDMHRMLGVALKGLPRDSYA